MFMTWLLALLLTVAVLVLIGLARVLGKDVPEVPIRPHGQDDAQAGHRDEVSSEPRAEEGARAAA